MAAENGMYVCIRLVKSFVLCCAELECPLRRNSLPLDPLSEVSSLEEPLNQAHDCSAVVRVIQSDAAARLLSKH